MASHFPSTPVCPLSRNALAEILDEACSNKVSKASGMPGTKVEVMGGSLHMYSCWGTHRVAGREGYMCCVRRQLCVAPVLVYFPCMHACTRVACAYLTIVAPRHARCLESTGFTGGILEENQVVTGSAVQILAGG